MGSLLGRMPVRSDWADYGRWSRKLINPQGFIDLVARNCPNPRDVSLDRDYRFILYNADRVSQDDLQAINDYMTKFDDGTTSILKDAGPDNPTRVESDAHSLPTLEAEVTTAVSAFSIG